MVTVTRDGTLIQQDELTDEQKEQGWIAVMSAFLRLHPEVLTGGQEGTGASTTPA